MLKVNNDNKKSKKRVITVVALILVTLLIISSVFIYYEYFAEKEIVQEKKEETEIIDNRISPLENQGIIVEILRIRDRGLLEKLITPLSRSWKTKPSFYYILKIDDFTYVSKDVASLGSSNEEVFTGWDTIFQETKVMKDIGEENKTSDVTITIVEQLKKGILRRRTQDVEREKIQLVYDYRTGRWTGDDFLEDYDGYGHYLGETFELWFRIYQNDYDTDSIPYWTEVNILDTNPNVDDSTLDPDGDGIPTAWEWKWGYDPFTWNDHTHLDPDIDGIENREEYQMAKYFADPYHQDIYVEADNEESIGLFGILYPAAIFWEESQQGIIERYSEHNINMYIDNGWPDTPRNGGGEILPAHKVVSQDAGMMLQYYLHHFPKERKGIFRYAVIGHGGAFSHPSLFTVVDTTHVGGASLKARLFKIRDGPPTQRAWRVTLGAKFMHEMGHTMGILPWTIEGNDNSSSYATPFTKEWRQYRDTWGQYYSVMNYFWLASYMDWFRQLFDYSDGSNGPPYDQNDWIHLYLPTFQTDSAGVEDPTAVPPAYNLVNYKLTAEERVDSKAEGWRYDEKLTETLTGSLGGYSPVDPVDCNWRVYVKENKTNEDIYDIKIYVQPNVAPTYSDYVLYKEGNVDKDQLQFYSQKEKINEVEHLISEFKTEQ